MRRLLSIPVAVAALLAATAAHSDEVETRDWLKMRSLDGTASVAVRLDLDRAASRRFAVVIGNDTYLNASSLENAAADARAMAAVLREQGFQVVERYNLDKRGFEDLMRLLLFELGPDSEVLFFFAGHGIQIGRRNYLLPTDAALKTPYDTPFETVTLDSIVRILGARTRRQLVILDSCRNNPFVDSRLMTEIDSTLFETGNGFSAMSAPVNSLIAYSTSPGALALDGEDANSPFTAALVRRVTTAPDQTMRAILSDVRREVYHKTEGRQVPWESSTLVEPFVFDVAANLPLPPTTSPETRGMQVIGAGEARAVTIDGDPTVIVPLDRRIALGPIIARTLGLDANARISIDQKLEHGALVLSGTGSVDYRGETDTVEKLDGLIYEYLPQQRPAKGNIADYTVAERITVNREGGEAITLTLQMEADPCDFEAGDWLDPEGIGLTRYPNEIDVDRAATACRLAVERYPDTGRFHYQLGRALQAKLDYSGAREVFTRASELGHTRAWHALGDLEAEADSIEGGQVNAAVSAKAMEFYARGVEKGDPYAYHALGKQLLRFGKTDVARRYGFELLGQALELGHTFSMNELGYYFLDKDSDHYEPERGLRYLRESARRNDIYGYNNLGLVYDRGMGGVEADPQEALKWYTLAADGGHPYAPVNIGRMYFNGRFGGGANATEAIRWYDEGLARGTAWGGANAAWIIANKRPAGFTLADAALRAAKTAVLRDEKPAVQAMAILDSLDARALDAASQLIIRDFDPAQVIDGKIGPKTRAAIDQLAQKHGFEPPPDDPKARLLKLARIYWRLNGVRIDLL